jgi:apolipoprotein N-acyltransferase
MKTWPSFGMATVTWFLGSLNMWHYLVGVIQLPLIVAVLAFLFPAVIFGIAVHLFRVFIRKGAVWRASFAFPAAWVAYEFLYALTSPHSTFGNLGYSQMNFLPVLQMASLAGIWGISFCLFLFPAAVAAIFSGQGSKTQRMSLAATVGGLFVAVIAYGSLRVAATPANAPSVKVALMASDAGDIFPQDDAAALKLLREYSEQVEQLAGLGAEVIVLPEKIARVSDPGTAQVDELFRATAARANAEIVVGIDRGSATSRFNEARIYSPGGAIETYDKHHMIPRFEDFDQPGTTLTVWNQPSGIWGIEICKDMDFPRLSRRYGAQGVAMLLVPAWDFVLDDWLHGRMAILRGVESGFTIARTAKQGLMTVSDNRGRVLAERGSAAAPFSYIFAIVPVRHDSTLYLRWGNWFAWLNVAGLILIVFSLFWKRGSAS